MALQCTTGKAIIHKTWNSGELSLEDPAHHNYPKRPTTTSRRLQASLASVHISVPDSTIRRPGQKWPLSQSSRAKTTTEQKNVKAHLIVMIPETFEKMLCGLTRQELTFLEGVCSIIMLPALEDFAVINGAMNSAVYQTILKETVRPSVHDLKLK